MQNDLTLYNFDLTKQEENENEINYTVLKVNEKTYAIATEMVQEIIKIPELNRPNNMPDCILGFFEYRQNNIPVIDLRQVFKENKITYGINSEIIILNIDNSQISIICDNVADILKLNKENIQEVPYQGQKEFFEGIYINNDDNPYIINVKNLLKYVDSTPQNTQEKTANDIAEDEEAKYILAERKNLLKTMRTDFQKTTPIFNMGVTFAIDNIKYYINLANVKEFFKLNNTKITKVPSVPGFVMGLINIKGEFITILDIRNFYDDAKTTIKEKSTVIIINSDEFKIGIMADEILESMNINYNEIIQNKLQKQEEDRPCEFVKNEEIYQVLDIEKLLQNDRLTIC